MPRITEMFVFVMSDDENDERVPSTTISSGLTSMLVGTNMGRIEVLKPYAQLISNAFGKPISIRRFSYAEEIDVIQPEG